MFDQKPTPQQRRALQLSLWISILGMLGAFIINIASGLIGDVLPLQPQSKPILFWTSAVLALILGVVIGWLHRRQQQFEPVAVELSAAKAREYRDKILAKVKKDWIDGLLMHPLGPVPRVALRLRERPDLIARPLAKRVMELNDARRPLPPGASILQAFDHALSGLLIVGSPGSGKTTLLCELARTLVRRAKQDQAEPIPIILNLASWSERRGALGEWLIEELNSSYGVPKKVGQWWVANHCLLPLLDGLDEVKAEHRAACIETINSYQQNEHGLMPLVICSRTEDYQAAQKMLRLEGAVEIEPLTKEQIKEQIDKHIRPGGPKLDGLSTLIDSDEQIAELARTPLMLQMIAIAYEGVTPEQPRTFRPGQELQERIFDTYIQKMFERGATPRYTREQTTRWLAWLAFRLRQQGLPNQFRLDRMQPTWLTSTGQRATYDLGVRLLVGLVVGLILGTIAANKWGNLPFGLIAGSISGVIFACIWERAGRWELWQAGGLKLAISEGLTYSVLYTVIWQWYNGLAFGAPGVWLDLLRSAPIPFILGLIGAGFGQTWRITPAERLKRWDWRLAFERGIPVGSVLGIASGWLSFGPSVITGVAVFAVMLFACGLTGPSMIEETITPDQGIRNSLYNALVWGLIMGFAFGLAVGISVASNKGTATAIPAGIGYGLSAFLVLGLAFGGYALLQHLILRCVLAGSHVAPLRYVQFLNFAADRTMLQKKGGSYSFFHPLLLDHLAMLESPQVGSKTKTHHSRAYPWQWRVAAVGIACGVLLAALGAAELVRRQAEAARSATEQSVIARIADLERRGQQISDIEMITLDQNPDDTNIKLCGIEGPGNFIAEAQFYNPYERWWTGIWDYGFRFRANSEGQYRLVIRANERWEFYWITDELNVPPLAQGVLADLDTAADGSNITRLVADGNQGYFFVNGHYVATLDISNTKKPGQIEVGTGFIEESEINDKQTRIEHFRVWSLDGMPVPYRSDAPPGLCSHGVASSGRGNLHMV